MAEANDVIAVRERVKAYLADHPEAELAQLSAHTSLSQSTCRHFVSGAGLSAGSMKSAAREFARVLRLIEAGDIAAPGAAAVVLTETHQPKVRRVRKRREFYQTATVDRVGQTLTYCAEQAAIGIITGDYGVGKTEAVQAWRRGAGRGVETVVFEFDEFSAGCMTDFVKQLGTFLGVVCAPGYHSGSATMRALCDELRARPVLLVLDQCECVRPRVMQVVRQIWDRTRDAGVGVVLLGAPVLLERLQASRLRDLDALASRIGVWVQLQGLSRDEVAAILRQEGITDITPDAFFLLWSSIRGSMRRLMAAVALLQAKHQGKPVTPGVVTGVAAHLWGMTPRGGIEAVA